MGRIFQSQTATILSPQSGNGGRVFGGQDNPNVQQIKELPNWPVNNLGNPKSWEDL